MKVLFMSCGIGMGHISRDMALAKRLQDKDVDVAFASYGFGYKILSESGKYEVTKLPDINFYGDDAGLDIKYTVKKSIDIPFVFIKSIYCELKVIKKFRPDIVVADSHYSVPITCKLLDVPCILITNELTLSFAELYPDEKVVGYIENGLKRFIVEASNQCSAIIIPDVEGSIEVPPKLRNVTIFTGPILKKNPDKIKDRKEVRRELGFNENDKIVLVTVGGSEFGKKLLKLIIDSVEWINCDKVVVVTGPQIASDFIVNSDKIVKKEFLEDIMEWMRLSDVVISLAGHNTIMELVSLGVPSIIVPIDNHPEQLKNALNMEKYGISIVRKIGELNSEDLADDINNMLYDEDFKKEGEVIKKEFSRYNGKETSVELILEYAKYKK